MKFIHEMCSDPELRDKLARQLFEEKLGYSLMEGDVVASNYIFIFSQTLRNFQWKDPLRPIHEVHDEAVKAVKSYQQEMRRLRRKLTKSEKINFWKKKAVNDDISTA